MLLILILCFQETISQTTSKFIVVDQFGYRPVSEKIAVMRDPLTGFDSSESFAPGFSYALVDATNGNQVFTGNSVPFNSGKENASSGDRNWWFDFSSYQVPGTYYILDISKNVKSYEFVINENVYEEILKHAVRTFYYQRAGYAKEAQYAGANWSDTASHLKPLQDAECRKYDTPNNASSERDLSGGWYDAGDYNKYTPWTANYIVDMIKAYDENPNAWGDNYNLPYSGNGMPDIIDEIKWGLDYLMKLQESNGSLISIVSLSHASPPSSATGQSLYGGVNTSSTLASTIAFAYGSKVFAELGMKAYSDTLLQRATNAWNWANANPNIIWENNSAAYNSIGIGAGQQETDDYGRFAYKIRAAIHLFDITNNEIYKTFVENNYLNVHLMLWNFAYPFEQTDQEELLYYASLSGLAHLTDYVWGSNSTKSRKGLMYTDYVNHNINSANNANALRAAERYIHYIHGVNPLNFCYLSNMYDYGADNGVNEFYHTWFGDGTDWDRVGKNPYGPAPGFLTGGPNPTYNWDSCCPSGCGNETCDITQRDRIMNQPEQKAYDDFNTSWPMNSWEITENSGGYQVAYIRLLSKFVASSSTLSVNDFVNETPNIIAYPNPFENELNIKSNQTFSYVIYDVTGSKISSGNCNDNCKIDNFKANSGMYFLKLKTSVSTKILKIFKQ